MLNAFTLKDSFLCFAKPGQALVCYNGTAVLVLYVATGYVDVPSIVVCCTYSYGLIYILEAQHQLQHNVMYRYSLQDARRQRHKDQNLQVAGTGPHTVGIGHRASLTRNAHTVLLFTNL